MSDEKTIGDVYNQVLAFHQETRTEYQTLHALVVRNISTNDRIEKLLERLQERMTAAEERITALEARPKRKARR